MRITVWLDDGALELVPRRDPSLRGAARVSVRDPAAARALASRVIRRAGAGAVIALLGSAVTAQRAARTDLDGALARALVRGEVTAWRRVHRLPTRAEGAGEDAEPLVTQSDPSRGKTWIEIELLDMDGNPVPGEPYSITLPDGTVREGSLDARGRAYFGGLDPGEAQVRWTARDGDATETAPARGQTPREGATTVDGFVPTRDERHWIEVELLDMDDRPIANERCGIRLPDGSVRYAWLDADGVLLIEGLASPGDCVVWFPDRDAAALEAVADATAPTGDQDALARGLTDASERGAARVPA